MDEGRLTRAARDAAARLHLQRFADDLDAEIGPPLEIDVDALGDDVGKLKSMLGRALHENKKVRTQAGNYRTKLRAAEQERETLKEQLTTATADSQKLKDDLETANRANGQYKANFKARLVDETLRVLLKEAGAVDVDLMLPAIKRESITCDDETFEVKGAKEVVDAFKTEKATLFTAKPPPSGGTNRSGQGPQGGAQGGGEGGKVDYRDPTKSLEQLEQESNLAMFGRRSISGV